MQSNGAVLLEEGAAAAAIRVLQQEGAAAFGLTACMGRCFCLPAGAETDEEAGTVVGGGGEGEGE